MTAPETTAETPPDAPDEPDEGVEGQESGNREAARYRVRAREAEAERDRLRGVVERFQRVEVERVVGDRLVNPTDLFEIAGATIADLLDEAGTVDPDAVTARVDELITARPYLAPSKPRATSVPGGARGAVEPPTAPGLAELFERSRGLAPPPG